MLGSPEFAEVMAGARRGEAWAMARLFEEGQPRLLRYLRAREPRVAEDLAGEVWVAVASGLERFEGDERDFRAWLFGIARRRVADHRRTGVRRATDPVTPETFAERTSGEDVESVALERASAQEAVDEIVGQLGAAQAEVVLLRVLGDLDVAHTARVMGRSEAWVRTTQHRALKKLARRASAKKSVTPERARTIPPV